MAFWPSLSTVIAVLLVLDGALGLLLGDRLQPLIGNAFPGLNLRHLAAAEILAGGALLLFFL